MDFFPHNISSLPQQGSGKVQDELTLIILIHRQNPQKSAGKTKNNLMPLTYCSENMNRDERAVLLNPWFQIVLKIRTRSPLNTGKAS